ncbi:MAG: FAD:protein FMN transferase [Acidobacteria bacterium]|nr:FAD:protein FMN transferase [Acidobacteriota bacterium]MYJ05967.1 FAD:protein FMN transferase [Acidobacteriota bacterium]
MMAAIAATVSRNRPTSPILHPSSCDHRCASRFAGLQAGIRQPRPALPIIYNPRRAMTRLLSAALLFFLAACTTNDLHVLVQGGTHRYRGDTMGTTYEVTVVADPQYNVRFPFLHAAIAMTLERIEAAMSTWRPESELSRFNLADTTDPFSVSPDTATVFQHALTVGALTGGAFDITVGPLVDAWGFGPPGHPPAAPSAADLTRLREQVGWERLAVDAEASTIRKLTPGASVDLSALAKGYAVDQVAELLDAEGFTNYLVEVGGEVRAAGRNARGEPWRVGIERPSAGPPTVYRTVELSGQALATSGDYRNTYVLDGQRVSHTIDPRTGQPVTHALASVSVIDPLCVRADALATGLMVLGPDDGFALATEQGWPALFLVRRPDGTLEELTTPTWAQFSAQ